MSVPENPLVFCDEDQVTLEILAERAGVQIKRIQLYLEVGLLGPSVREEARILFPLTALMRLRAIERLRRDTGANLAGIAMILELVDRLRHLQRELERRQE